MTAIRTTHPESMQANFDRYSYLFASNWKELSEISKQRLLRQKVAAIDTETTGLESYNHNVVATHASYWTNEGNGSGFPVTDKAKFAELKRICEDPTITKLIFSAEYDSVILRRHGIRIRGPVICVLMAAQMALGTEFNKNLKHLARKYLKYLYLEKTRLDEWRKQNKGQPWGNAPAHIIEPYVMADSKNALELFYYIIPYFDKHNQWHILEREMLLMSRVVMGMEEYGALLNKEEVDRLAVATRKELAALRDKMVAITGDPKFNPNSNKQVMAALIKEGVFVPTRFSKDTGKPKADAIALLETPSDLGVLVAQHRQTSKAAGTYIKNFSKPILRVSFNQCGARTGRFSCSGPNLQNIPRPKEGFLGQTRKCFIARPGCKLLFIDYEQIEMRLTAHFSEEEHMLEAILRGEDLHDKTCERTFSLKKSSPSWDLMRYMSKTLNFQVLYGSGPDKFRQTILKQSFGKIRISIQQAANYIEEWKSAHPKVMKLFDSTAIEIAKTGGVTNFYGRFMPVDPDKPYVGVNYKVQGTAADFLKKKMLIVAQFMLDKLSKLFLQVHDELVFNLVRQEIWIVQQLADLMEDRTTFKVPLTVSASYGQNWHDKKKIQLVTHV